MTDIENSITNTQDVIRVCQLWSYYLPIFSGAAIRHNQLAPFLRDKEISLEVLTPQWEGTYLEEVVNEVPVHRVPVGPYKNKVARALISTSIICQQLWKRRHDYDIIHSFTTGPFCAMISIVAKLLHKPVVIDFTLLESKSRSTLGNLLSRFSYFVFRFMDAYVCLSSPLTRQLREKGLSTAKIHLIPVGVFTDLYKPLNSDQRKTLRDELGLYPSSFYLIFVGSFIQRKGADILVEMMERLHMNDGNFHLVIVGDYTFPHDLSYQQFSDKLISRIKENGLEPFIHIVGRVESLDTIRWLQASDIFIFPSRREGLPRVVLEAMSVGLPCIISSMEGVANDLIDPEVNGVIVEENDAQTFAQQVYRLAADSPFRCRIGSSARQRVENHFDEIKMATEYKRLYAEILS